MLCCSTPRWAPFRSWLRDYDKIQWVAVLFIYIQIACALVGSLGALYNGVLLINLVVALFALIAIESNSQSLGRTYAVLLACAILLDVAWFILFSHAIWNISSDKYGPFVIFSVRLALWMQIIGFSVRSLSSLLWIQMYRLGVSSVESTSYQEVDFDLRNSFLNPSNPGLARQNSVSDEILGGSIYDPAYYSSLFEDPKDNGYANAHDGGSVSDDGGTTSAAESSQLKSCISRSFQDGSAVRKPQTS
ncbi:uncharacterized protein LOC131227415 isoform X2 [Magnolia sinica]|uniref:uncharacterized protein LOC131227415 isoform X2 n=1 Tax=Magnolia sinica TaxID=86752 RepID=UPI00265B01BF|nr:uncharacterized protein LOC131227415 isoform X2 [Magnolia sinica]